jgi:hypothetical protein
MILRDDTGSTMVIVTIIALVMLIISLALVELGAQDATLAARDERASRAFYTAEAGVERGEAWLSCQDVMPMAPVMPFSAEPEGFNSGLMLVAITPDASGPRMVYTIRSLATVGGKSRALEVDVTPTAFTDYLYYVNQDVGPGSPGYFRTGDIVDGPIHLNDLLAVWGDPVFEAEVRTTSSEILYQNNWNPIQSGALQNAPYDNPDFQAGIELGVSEIPWLDEGDLNTLKGMAGLSLANKKLIFGRDAGSGPMLGYVSYSHINQNTWTDVDLSTFNGIIYVGGSCEVSGILDGQVTVVNNSTIEIVDDLTYADSDANGPRPGCDDILGLVASTKINIADNVPNGTDCVVHAHIMSMNNQASLVENYSQGSPRGTLSIHGGLAQDKWGPVGTGYYDYQGDFHILTGYERDFHYDWRLRSLLPPGYAAIIYKGGGMDRLAWREITPVDLTGWEG